MEEEIKTCLEDIQKAISEIEEFIPDKKDFFEFERDTKTRRAVERNIEIIGEAVYRILKIDSDINIPSSRKIVDTRNRIIHGYDKVSSDILWSIIVRDIPTLKLEIESLLK